MIISNIQQCKNCGENHPVGQRCFCQYEEMDKRIIKPSASTIDEPFYFFETFIANGNPYCFLYQFYLTGRLNCYINESDEIIYKMINIPGQGQFIDPRSKTYRDYVNNLFKAQVEKSVTFCEERLYYAKQNGEEEKAHLNRLIKQLEAMVRLEKGGIYYFSNLNILGESDQIMEIFEINIQILLNQLEKRKSAKRLSATELYKLVTMKDILSNDEKKIDRYEKDIYNLIEIGYFNKTEKNIKYIKKDWQSVAAIVERWKKLELFRKAYLNYDEQPIICHAFCNSFGLVDKFGSINKYFKKGALISQSTERVNILNHNIRNRMTKIELAIDEMNQLTRHLL